MKNSKNNPIAAVIGEMVIDYLSKTPGIAQNYKQIASKLGFNDPHSRALLQDTLSLLTKNGNLSEPVKGRFAAKATRSMVEGVVDVTSTGSAYVICEGLEKDVYIAPRKLRQALHGDKVVVHLYAKKQSGKLEGEVIQVLQRAKSEYTGIVHIEQKYAFLVPDDRKMMHDLLIPERMLKGAKNGDKALAKMIEWPDGAKNPIGEILHVLGKQGAHNTEMQAILADYGFPLQFTPETIAESEHINEDISDEEIKKRRDFRKTLTFTIDPVDAKDFDDAISFEKLPNGNYEIGVHIADVSHYIKPKSALDKEAAYRATSVYLVDRVIPMLPEKLSNELCSLRPNEDKLTFSAVFELDEAAHIHKEWFGRTIIHSRRRYAYEEVQEILETGEGDNVEALQILNKIAYKMREQRFKTGAINFETQEVKFKLDESGAPIGVYVKERKDSHKLIEDFMLLANKRVAEFVAKQRKGKDKNVYVYRTHDAPGADNLIQFAKFAAKFGYKINTSSPKATSNSLNDLMRDVEGKNEQNVLTSLAIRSMAKAIYTTQKTSHYGLAFDYYTHFTSPIRRYPDVMSHRLLQHYLDGGAPVDAEVYEALCKHSSDMEKKAAEAERASVKYKQAEYMQNQVGNQFKGVISGLTEWGMYVEIMENKCEGMVRLRDLSDDFYELDQENYRIVGRRYKRTYQLGDEVIIEVKKVSLVKRQLDFSLV